MQATESQHTVHLKNIALHNQQAGQKLSDWSKLYLTESTKIYNEVHGKDRGTIMEKLAKNLPKTNTANYSSQTYAQRNF